MHVVRKRISAIRDSDCIFIARSRDNTEKSESRPGRDLDTVYPELDMLYIDLDLISRLSCLDLDRIGILRLRVILPVEYPPCPHGRWSGQS